MHEHLQQSKLVDHAELLPVGDAGEVLGLVAVYLALGHFLPDGLNAVHEPILELVVHPLLRSPPAVLEKAQPLLDSVVVALKRLVFAGFVGLGREVEGVLWFGSEGLLDVVGELEIGLEGVAFRKVLQVCLAGL